MIEATTELCRYHRLSAILLVASIIAIGSVACGRPSDVPDTPAFPEISDALLAESTLCSLAAHIGAAHQSTDDVTPLQLARGPDQIGLRLSETQPSQSVPLYRVSGGFFTPEGLLGVTNAGNAEIVLYASDGSVFNRFGSAGPGPSEFGMLAFARYSPTFGAVIAYDMSGMTVKMFDVDGTFLRSVRIRSPGFSIYDVYPLNDGRFIAEGTSVPDGGSVMGPRHGLIRSYAPVLLVDSEGMALREIARIRGRDHVTIDGEGDGFSIAGAPFTNWPWLWVDPAGCFVHPLDDEPGFAVLTADGESHFHATLPFIDLSLSRQHWNDRLDRLRRYGQIAEFPRPDRKPAWYSGRFDGGVRLWLEGHRHLDELAASWWVVDLASGTADLVRPPEGAVRMLAANPHRVAVLVRDAYDVESVRLFDVVRVR